MCEMDITVVHVMDNTHSCIGWVCSIKLTTALYKNKVTILVRMVGMMHGIWLAADVRLLFSL